MMTTEQEIKYLREGVNWRDERIRRLEEINTDLAGEVDRLWNEGNKCPNCGTVIKAKSEVAA